MWGLAARYVEQLLLCMLPDPEALRQAVGEAVGKGRWVGRKHRRAGTCEAELDPTPRGGTGTVLVSQHLPAPSFDDGSPWRSGHLAQELEKLKQRAWRRLEELGEGCCLHPTTPAVSVGVPVPSGSPCTLAQSMQGRGFWEVWIQLS